MESVGILIGNLGSPDSPVRQDVAKFLGEFLSDPYVVDLPIPLRQILAKGIIATTRSKSSSEAYASIWDSSEGPLRRYTQEVADKIRNATSFHTVVGMRYGRPSLDQAIADLRDCPVIVLAMLYPQHADSTRTTTIRYVKKISGGKKIIVVPAYYNEPGYLDALVRRTITSIHDDIEHVVISFHGLPVSHISRADPTKSHCLKTDNCCETDSSAHVTCYLHQCRFTAAALGVSLKLPYSIGFQSRLGRLPWLEPATTEVISDLSRCGVKRIAVTCPSFIVDNLETLEEIGIQAREQFLTQGGEKLQLLPCLNTDSDWIKFFSQFIQKQLVDN